MKHDATNRRTRVTARRRRKGGAMLLAIAALALAPLAANAQLKVVTSTTDLYDIAKAVGGDRVEEIGRAHV